MIQRTIVALNLTISGTRSLISQSKKVESRDHYLSFCFPYVNLCLFIYQLINLSIFLSISQSIYSFIYFLSIYLLMNQSIYLSVLCLSLSLFSCSSTYLSVCLLIHLPTYLSIYFSLPSLPIFFIISLALFHFLCSCVSPPKPNTLYLDHFTLFEKQKQKKKIEKEERTREKMSKILSDYFFLFLFFSVMPLLAFSKQHSHATLLSEGFQSSTEKKFKS